MVIKKKRPPFSILWNSKPLPVNLIPNILKPISSIVVEVETKVPKVRSDLTCTLLSPDMATFPTIKKQLFLSGISWFPTLLEALQLNCEAQVM